MQATDGGAKHPLIPRLAAVALTAATGAMAAIVAIGILTNDSEPPRGQPSPSPNDVMIPDEVARGVWVGSVDGVPSYGTITGDSSPLKNGAVGLDAFEGLVLSAAISDAETALTITDAATGELIAALSTPMTVGHGVIRGNRIYWDGTAEGRDAGVWTADLTDLAIVQAIAPHGEEGATRGPLHASPSGLSVGSTVCNESGCATETRDAFGATIEIAASGGLMAMTDEVALVIDGPTIRAFRSGIGIWELSTSRTFFGSLPSSDGSAFVISSTEADGAGNAYVIAEVDSATGARRVLFTRPGDTPQLRLIASLSSDNYATLVPGFTIDEALADVDAAYTIIDLRDGSVVSDAVLRVQPQ